MRSEMQNKRRRIITDDASAAPLMFSSLQDPSLVDSSPFHLPSPLERPSPDDSRFWDEFIAAPRLVSALDDVLNPSIPLVLPRPLPVLHGVSNVASLHAANLLSCVITSAIPLDPRIAVCVSDTSLFFDAVLKIILEGQSTSSTAGSFCLSMGLKKAPTLHDGLSAITRFEAAHENYAVLALNLSATRFEDFYFAQNFKSVPHIGEVARNLPNSKFRSLIGESSMIGFVRYVLFCVQFAPNEDVSFSCKVLLVTGEVLLRLIMTFSNGMLLVGGECRG